MWMARNFTCVLQGLLRRRLLLRRGEMMLRLARRGAATG